MTDIDDTLGMIKTADTALDEALDALRNAVGEAENNRDAFAAMSAAGVAQLMQACVDALEEAVTSCQAASSSLEDATARATEAKEAGG